jgi:hypothetical protein
MKESVNLVSLSLRAPIRDTDYAIHFLWPLLSALSSDRLYCPRLEKLTTEGIPGHVVKKYAQLRRDAGYPLASVRIAEDDQVDVESEMWLDEFTDLRYVRSWYERNSWW